MGDYILNYKEKESQVIWLNGTLAQGKSHMTRNISYMPLCMYS
jgi:tRNA A37 threonylcarbamoyladenosine biosynthesis protein TsaE